MPVYLDAKDLDGAAHRTNGNGPAVNGQPGRPSATGGDRSPAMNIPLVFPKKKYSLSRDDSLVGLPTPTFDQKEVKAQKTGPSSRTTVLAMSGLFVVGITLMLSGFIVLIQHREKEFIITGCVFMGVGLLMLIVCVVLQRKNVVKLMHQLDQDLYFLNITGNPMWKLMFEATEIEHGINRDSRYSDGEGRPNSTYIEHHE